MPDAVRQSGERNRSFLPSLIVSVCFGAAAGAVGALIGFAYLTPTPVVPGSFSVLRNLSRQPLSEEFAPRAEETIGRSATLFFAQKPGGGALIERSYVPGEAIGAGMVLTSDGWIVTHGDLLPSKDRRARVALIGARAYEITRTVRDPYSGVAFVKVEAQNLPVTSFGSAKDLASGDVVFAFDAAGGLRRLDVIARDAAPAHSTADLLRSSERIQRLLRVTGPAAPVGAMVLDQKGDVIGVYAGGDGLGATVVPFDAFSSIVGAVLRDKEPARPYAGVRYLDLSELAGDRDADLPSRGALLAPSPDGKVPAVMKRSPADVAGLRADDIVVAVDDVQVTAKNALADLLADYQPGETVTFTVARPPGAERKVDLTLGMTPVP